MILKCAKSHQAPNSGASSKLSGLFQFLSTNSQISPLTSVIALAEIHLLFVEAHLPWNL